MKKTYFIFISLLLLTMSLEAQVYDDEIPSNSKNKIVFEEKQFHDFRFTIGGGYARRLGEIEKTNDAQVNKILDGLINGYNIDFSMQYYLKQYWGIGINAYLNRQASDESQVEINRTMYNDARESTNHIYVGPSFCVRTDLSSLFTFHGSVGLGMLYYIDRFEFGDQSITYQKPVFASYVSAAVDYNINNNMGAGLKLSVGGGTVAGEDFGKTERLSVSNFMLTGYLSFRISK